MITSVRDSFAPARNAPLSSQVEEILGKVRADDIHTHLYDPGLGGLLLWGIDELLVYHYLVAEAFRFSDVPYAEFWRLPKREQAELIWDRLFLEHSPVSEACRGVITTLNRLGLDVRPRDLEAVRQWFSRWNIEEHVSCCMDLAGVRSVCMTNSPFDPEERAAWDNGWQRDERFRAGLRIDPLLLAWEEAGAWLSDSGYAVSSDLTAKTQAEVGRFLREWAGRLAPRYLMVSLSPEFAYPSAGIPTAMLEKVLLPFCREAGVPLALMPGVRRLVNPELKLAGDGVGAFDLQNLARLCAAFPENKFLTTVLARENQHELCVLARKFRNLHLFGCWWFTNIPSVVEEITRMRVDLLGLSFTFQHSDARVLEQLIYKWQHARPVLARVLTEKYAALEAAGWPVSAAEIQRDAEQLLGGAFRDFCAR